MVLRILGFTGEIHLGMSLRRFVDRTHGLAQDSHPGNWLAQESVVALS
jgi:hypothetical protein